MEFGAIQDMDEVIHFARLAIPVPPSALTTVSTTAALFRYRLKPQEEPSFTVAGLEPHTHVVFRIRAINEDGWSTFSEIGGPYRAEDFIESSNVGSRTVELHWRPSPTVVTLRWEVQVRLHTGPAQDDQYSTVTDNIVDAPSMRFVATALRPGSTYMFRVRGHDRFGWRSHQTGLITHPIKTVAIAPDAPSMPFCNGLWSTATTILLEWTPGWCNGPQIEEQEIYWSVNNGPWEQRELLEDPVATSYRVDQLRTGQSYAFKVRTRNELGWSDFSIPSDLITTNSIACPHDLRVNNRGISWIELMWSPELPGVVVEQYEVQQKQLDGDGWATIAANIHEPRFLAEHLKPLKKFQFRVRFRTVGGWSAYTDPTEPMQTVRRY